ncbi:unnamed protein product [Candida verbasci]|uniref:Uncharacterized protein n=1 Tax=Candida verbasci TaxID=1227364 RepID=A0A9W4U022_9ASCO|nr:unnamed protein product [Candida verbasci]
MVGIFNKRRSRPDSYQGFSKYAHEINNYHNQQQEQQQQHLNAGLPVQSTQVRSQSMTSASQAAAAALRLHSSPIKQSPSHQTLAQKQYGRSNSLSYANANRINGNRSNSLRSNSLKQYTYTPKPSYSPGPLKEPTKSQPRRYNSLNSNASYIPKSVNLHQQDFIEEENDRDFDEEEITVTTTETKILDSQGRVTSITTKIVKQLPDGSEVVETKTKNISRMNSRANSLSSTSQPPNFNRTNSITNQTNLKKIDEHLHNFDYDYQVDSNTQQQQQQQQQQPLNLNQENEIKELGPPFEHNNNNINNNNNNNINNNNNNNNNNSSIQRTSSIASSQKPLRSILKSTPRPNFDDANEQNITASSSPTDHPYKSLRDNKLISSPPQQAQQQFSQQQFSPQNGLTSPASSIKFNDNVTTIPIQADKKKNISSPPQISKPKASNQQIDADFYAAAMQAAYKKVYGENAVPPPQPPQPIQPIQQSSPLQDNPELNEKHKKFGFIPLSPKKQEHQPRTNSIDSLVENKLKKDHDAFERKNEVEQQQQVPSNYKYQNHYKEFAVHSMRDDPKINKGKAKEEKRRAKEQAEEEKKIAKEQAEEEKRRAKEQAEEEKRRAKEQAEEDKRRAKEQAELEKKRKKEERKSKFRNFFGLNKDKRRNSYNSSNSIGGSSFESNQKPKEQELTTSPIQQPIKETNEVPPQAFAATTQLQPINESTVGAVQNSPIQQSNQPVQNTTIIEEEPVIIEQPKQPTSPSRKPVPESPLIEKENPISSKDISKPIDSKPIGPNPIESTQQGNIVKPVETEPELTQDTTVIDSQIYRISVPRTISDDAIYPSPNINNSQRLSKFYSATNETPLQSKQSVIQKPQLGEIEDGDDDHENVDEFKSLNDEDLADFEEKDGTGVYKEDDGDDDISVYDDEGVRPVNSKKDLSNVENTTTYDNSKEIKTNDFSNAAAYESDRILNEAYTAGLNKGANREAQITDSSYNTGLSKGEEIVEIPNQVNDKFGLEKAVSDVYPRDAHHDEQFVNSNYNTGLSRGEEIIKNYKDNKDHRESEIIDAYAAEPYEKISKNDAIEPKESSSYEQVEKPVENDVTPQINATPNFSNHNVSDEVKPSAFVKDHTHSNNHGFIPPLQSQQRQQQQKPSVATDETTPISNKSYPNTNNSTVQTEPELIEAEPDSQINELVVDEKASKKSRKQKKPSKFKEKFFKYFINTYD